MLDFVKQIAEDNNIKVSEKVLKRVALILESDNHKFFFFDEEEEGLSPWVGLIVTLIHACNQNCEALYIQEKEMYPTTTVAVAIQAAKDIVSQEGMGVHIYKVDEEGYNWFATVTPEHTVYSK